MAAGSSASPLKVLKSDMDETMLAEGVEIANKVFAEGKDKLPKDLATAMKQAVDAKYPPVDNKATNGVYHVIVGSNFACSVTHETHFSCFLQYETLRVLVWKSKDSPFD